MDVLVIGGRGFLGSHLVEGIESFGLNVSVGGRSGAVKVDLNDPKTFENVRPYPIIVNASDSYSAPPDKFARFCLEENIIFIETTSEADTIKRLLELKGEKGSGTLVLGGGIFTGMSNLLCSHVARDETERIDLGIKFSPFSEGGDGMVNLMKESSGTPSHEYQKGELVVHRGITSGPELSFGGKKLKTLLATFPELFMVKRSLNVPNVRVGLALTPAFLRTSYLLMPQGLVRIGFVKAMMGIYFAFLRKIIFKGKAGEVHLLATDGSRSAEIQTDDGMRVAGLSVGAMILEIAEGKDLPMGTFAIDEVFNLGSNVALIETLHPGALTLKTQEI